MRTSLHCMVVLLATSSSVEAEKFPTHEEVASAKSEFLSLARPISYVSASDDDDFVTIRLKGETKAYADRHSGPAMVHALWNYLSQPDQAAEAVIIIVGVADDAVLIGGDPLTYISQAQPGNWEEWKEDWVRKARLGGRRIVDAFHDASWYPRIPLFDYAAVRRDATNAVLRAQAIEGMRAALRDPGIKDNPAELEDILYCLGAIKAEEAIPEILPFLFYDMRTKSDFRLRLEDFAVPNSNAPPSFDPVVDYAKLRSITRGRCFGWSFLASIPTEQSLNSFLGRMSRTTQEERLLGLGGGCVAAVARAYLYHYESDNPNRPVGTPRRKPWVIIGEWIAAHPDLTPEQISALNEIAEATRTWEPDYVPPPAQPSPPDPPPPSE